MQKETIVSEEGLDIEKISWPKEEANSFVLCVVFKGKDAAGNFKRMNDEIAKFFDGKPFRLYIDFSAIALFNPKLLKHQLKTIKSFDSNPSANCVRCVLVLGSSTKKLFKPFLDICQIRRCRVTAHSDAKEAWETIKAH